jgi:PAS domain S-box-containing protein
MDTYNYYLELFKDVGRSVAMQNDNYNATYDNDEDKFRGTFEQAAVGMAHVAPDGRWLDVNRTLCRIVGYEKEELLHLTFQDITHPDDLATDLDYVWQMLEGKIKTYSMEKRYIKKSGAIIWINLTVSLIRDKVTGSPLFFVAVIEDIDQRKKMERKLEEYKSSMERLVAERTVELFNKKTLLEQEIADKAGFQHALKAQNDFLNTVIEAMPFPFLVVDAASRIILLANSKVASEGRWQGKTCHSITHRSATPCEESDPACPCPVNSINVSGKPVVVEHVHVDTSGEQRLYEVHGVPIRGDTGRIEKVIEFTIDITEKKKSEEERETLIKELQTALAKINLLQGFIPMCASCKKIRDDNGFWNSVEKFIRKHEDAEFTHSICPDCAMELYGIDLTQRTPEDPQE